MKNGHNSRQIHKNKKQDKYEMLNKTNSVLLNFMKKRGQLIEIKNCNLLTALLCIKYIVIFHIKKMKPGPLRVFAL